VGRRLAAVLGDADTATGQRPQQFLGERRPGARIDEDVRAPVAGDALLPGEIARQPYPAVDPERGEFGGDRLPAGTVADDERGPVPPAEFGEREQEPVEVGVGRKRRRGDDIVGRVGSDRSDPLAVDRSGDPPQTRFGRAEVARAGADDRGGDDGGLGRAGGPAGESSARPLGAVPADDQRRAAGRGRRRGRPPRAAPAGAWRTIPGPARPSPRGR